MIQFIKQLTASRIAHSQERAWPSHRRHRHPMASIPPLPAAPRSVAAVDTRASSRACFSTNACARRGGHGVPFRLHIHSSSHVKPVGNHPGASQDVALVVGASEFYRGSSGFAAAVNRRHTTRRTASSGPEKSRRYRARVVRRRGDGAARACWSLEVSVATSAFVSGTVATLLKR